MGMLARRTGIAAIVALLSVVGASQAHAAATMTYPANGSTVRLDKTASFDFRWELPPGESGAWVMVADKPTYDPDTLQPFEPYCGFDVGQTGLSCRGDDDARPLDPGTHYALITSTDASGSAQLVSPVARFTVPYRIGLGCSPRQPGCRDRTIQSLSLPFGDITYPHAYSQLVVHGWFNGRSNVRVTYTLRHGRKLVKRIRDTRRADTYYSFISSVDVYRLPGVRPKTQLTCTITISGGNVHASRTVHVRAGAGPRSGTRIRR